MNPIRANDSYATDGRVLVWEPTSSSEVYRTNWLYVGNGTYGGVELGARFDGKYAFNANLLSGPNSIAIALFSFNNSIKAYINTGGSYIQPSDIRLKENINLLPDALEHVCQLQPKTFSFKSDTDKKITTGFIAQDVETIFPDVIESYDDKGVETKSLHMTGLVPYLVSAVKSLNNKVTTLESELAEIKRTLALLVPPATT